MPVEQLLLKAKRLLKTERVQYLEGGMYSVLGDHGVYQVQVLEGDRLTCTCEGFQKRRMCSHVMAVILRRSEKRLHSAS